MSSRSTLADFPARAAFALCWLAAAAAPCHAELGGAASHFDHVQPSIQPKLLAAGKASYSVSVSTLDSGTVVREYLLPSGTVFAVSWNGPMLPDLHSLLGKHFATMTAEAAKTPRAGHSHLALAHSDLVIESGGHMRAFTGRAWLPAALPAGMTPDDIE